MYFIFFLCFFSARDAVRRHEHTTRPRADALKAAARAERSDAVRRRKHTTRETPPSRRRHERRAERRRKAAQAYHARDAALKAAARAERSVQSVAY